MQQKKYSFIIHLLFKVIFFFIKKLVHSTSLNCPNLQSTMDPRHLHHWLFESTAVADLHLILEQLSFCMYIVGWYIHQTFFFHKMKIIIQNYIIKWHNGPYGFLKVINLVFVKKIMNMVHVVSKTSVNGHFVHTITFCLLVFG